MKKLKKRTVADDILDQANKPVLDLTRINFSMVSMYLRCPRQFHFRYVLGKKEPPKISLLEGSSHHAALEMNNIHKKERGFDLKAATITEKFMDELRGRAKETENLSWEEESEDGLAERATVWHKEYMARFAPGIIPDIVEEKFEKEIVLNGKACIISGVVDLGYAGKVTDYKTSSAYGYQNKKKGIDHDLQLSLYSWATGRRQVENICFVKKNIPEVGRLESSRTKHQILWALQIAERVMDAVNKEVFPPTDPTNWCCSERFCGYWGSCAGAKK